MSHISRLTWTHRATLRRTLLAALVPLAMACGGGGKPAESPDEPPSLDDDSASEGGGAVAASSPKVKEGIDAIQAGDFATAEGALAEARSENPDDPQAAFYLGVAYEGLEDIKSAKKAYREALELDPELTEASVNLSGVLLDVDQKPESALKVVVQGLKHAPNHAGLLLNRALVAEAMEDWPAAVDAWGKLVKQTKDRPDWQLSYAMALHKAGNKGLALRQLSGAAKSQDLKILAPAARMYGVLGAYKKCVQAFDRALEIKKLPELLVRRALCRNASEDAKGAVADLQEALNMDSKYAPAYLHLGIVFKEQDKTAEAKHNLKQAIANGEGTPVADQAKKELSDLK